MSLRVTRLALEVLGQAPGAPQIFEVDADSTLVLDHEALAGGTISPSAKSLVQDIGLGGVLIGLQDSVHPTLVLNRTIVSALSLQHQVNLAHVKAGAIAADADSTLSLSQLAIKSTVVDADSVLDLEQSASAHHAHTADSELELDQALNIVVFRAARLAESDLDLVQTVAFVHIPSDARPELCTYAPFIGGGPMPATPVAPDDGITARFALIYPATGSPTDTLELRAPQFGNKDSFRFTRINRESRGGTLIVFADPIWPKIQTQQLSFSALTQTQAEDLLTFMKAHIGQEIKVTDWEKRAWKGVITTPGNKITQDRRGSFSASFEFEGALIT